ncbi:MAG: Lar family restriction alleviation protein [Clostridium sp.]|nr:Lar family restriction alleviation protein [Clostridium sp.]
MPEIKLKPCPFCGGLPILNNEKNRACSFVKCIECGAESGLVKVSAEYCSDEKAAEAWNRRTSNETD